MQWYTEVTFGQDVLLVHTKQDLVTALEVAYKVNAPNPSVQMRHVQGMCINPLSITEYFADYVRHANCWQDQHYSIAEKARLVRRWAALGMEDGVEDGVVLKL